MPPRAARPQDSRCAFHTFLKPPDIRGEQPSCESVRQRTQGECALDNATGACVTRRTSVPPRPADARPLEPGDKLPDAGAADAERFAEFPDCDPWSLCDPSLGIALTRSRIRRVQMVAAARSRDVSQAIRRQAAGHVPTRPSRPRTT